MLEDPQVEVLVYQCPCLAQSKLKLSCHHCHCYCARDRRRPPPSSSSLTIIFREVCIQLAASVLSTQYLEKPKDSATDQHAVRLSLHLLLHSRANGQLVFRCRAFICECNPSLLGVLHSG